MIIVDETDYRFEIKPSTIAGAGDGCFAREFIPQGEFLEVIGVLVRVGSPADRCTSYANSYKFAAQEKNPTCYIVPLGYAGLVNHTGDKSLQNVTLAYSKTGGRHSHAGQVRYEAIRDIMPGEELLGYYGDGLNKVLKTVAENVALVDENKEEWEKFLAYNLYDLGILKL